MMGTELGRKNPRIEVFLEKAKHNKSRRLAQGDTCRRASRQQGGGRVLRLSKESSSKQTWPFPTPLTVHYGLENLPGVFETDERIVFGTLFVSGNDTAQLEVGNRDWFRTTSSP